MCQYNVITNGPDMPGCKCLVPSSLQYSIVMLFCERLPIFSTSDAYNVWIYGGTD